VLSQNLLKGTLPGCLFTAAPKLKSLSLDYLELSSTIPAEIKEAPNLHFFSAVHANLVGQLPHEMQCLGRMAILNLRNNHLTGTIPQVMMNGMNSLYSITLSFNGAWPAPCHHAATPCGLHCACVRSGRGCKPSTVLLAPPCEGAFGILPIVKSF
jgi:hypothetical protein